MKFKGKEIKILYMYVKLKHKEADSNRQDQKETDRNSRNRQDYISDIEKTAQDRGQKKIDKTKSTVVISTFKLRNYFCRFSTFILTKTVQANKSVHEKNCLLEITCL